MHLPLIILDTNVLFGATTRGLLFQFAAHGLWRCGWSQDIQHELARLGVFSEGFTLLTGDYQTLPPAGLPDPDDEHVLHCALAHQAAMILTYNLKDFPPHLMRGIRVLTPDAALVQTLEKDSHRSMKAIKAHWGDCDEKDDWASYVARLNRARLHSVSRYLGSSRFRDLSSSSSQ
jgi:hypothetical protein